MITREQYQFIDETYTHYNNELFGGKLNDCVIILNRSKKYSGFFAPGRWNKKKPGKVDEKEMHEIGINPDYFDRPDEEWQQTLVHEMCHLWQRDFGKISRAGYHNKQWADKMEEIGLMPSTTGKPGGKKTGQKMLDYIIPNGLFIQAFNNLKKKNIKYVSSPLLYDPLKIKKASAKKKYSCACGVNVWGKPGLDIICAACKSVFTEAE
jgi:predicted SprT family Zn-dependent metalloprotease